MEVWSGVMQVVTGLGVAWQTLQPFVSDANKDKLINYNTFLSRYQLTIDPDALKKSSPRRSSSFAVPVANSAPTPEASSKVNLDKLYGNREQLMCIFRFFDVDCSGTISKSEFENGINVMMSKRPELTMPSADVLWSMLDIDGNNEIDVNEFFEIFRVVDTFTASTLT